MSQFNIKISDSDLITGIHAARCESNSKSVRQISDVEWLQNFVVEQLKLSFRGAK